MPTTVLGLLGVLLCVTSEVTPQTDFRETLITSTMTSENPGGWSTVEPVTDEVSELPIVGGWSKEVPVTEDVENICIEVVKQAGVKFDVFIPKAYRYQIVAGTNYVVKVKVGLATYLNAMIYQALPGDGGKLTVKGVQYPITKTNPLVPF